MKKQLMALIMGLTAGVAAAQVAEESYARFVQAGVSQELAEWRKQTFSQVHYRLFFAVPEQRTEPVNGEMTLSLTVQHPEPIILDFREPAACVRSVKANGQPVTYRLENEHLIIPKTAVQAGLNQISIDFIAGNQSLNRNEEFLYTLLVPDRARTLFPCLDQPGIKAHFQLTLEIPADWKAVSNTYVQEESVSGNRKRVTFGETEPLSTYLFSFVAGKFQQQTYDDGKHTFSAYYRETDPQKLKQLDTIFRQVAASLAWQENYTGVPYPFAKYDFVILPGFQYGGMEHTGATLYNDTRMFLSEHPTLDEELARTELIAHETSHMWFGDLVTMNWFDDVWTKEVFANHYAACISEPLFPEVNHRLNRLKTFQQASLSEDRTGGTTSIRQPLENLNQAGLVYGQIIYNKAPVMMEKLVELMGEEAFRKGIQTYVKRYAYSNATWDNLIEILDSLSSADLKQFSEVWVNQKGMPDISMQVSEGCLTVKQEDPYRRGLAWPQRFQVTLSDGTRSEQVNVNLAQAAASVSLPEGFHPRYLLPNTDGRGYGCFLLDSCTTNWLLLHWQKIEDETARYATLMNLQENYLRHRISAADWHESVREGLRQEPNALIASTLVGYLTATLDELAGEVREEAEKQCWTLSQQHPLPSCRLQLLRELMHRAVSPAIVAQLYDLWKNQQHELLNEQDYTALAYELAIRHPLQAQEILTLQRSRIADPDRLRQFDFISRAVHPEQTARDSLFRSLMLAENRRIEPWTASVLRYLNHPLYEEQAVGYILPGLEVLQEVQRTGDIFFPRNWVGALLAEHRSRKAYEAVKSFLEAHPDYPALLKNKILQAAYPLFRIHEEGK